MLRDVEGLSTLETAECLGINEETVKTRLHRARRQMRRQFSSQLESATRDAFAFPRGVATESSASSWPNCRLGSRNTSP